MSSDQDFSSAVLAASARPEVPEAVQQLYRRLDQEIQRRQPICQLSGRCCHFDSFGHRLFITTLEMADFLAGYRREAARSRSSHGEAQRSRADSPEPPGLATAKRSEAGPASPPFDVQRSTLDSSRRSAAKPEVQRPPRDLIAPNPSLPILNSPNPEPPGLATAKRSEAGLPIAQSTGHGCPFQLNKQCSLHPIRPFGCRIFFCDPTATQWQNDQYELFHSDLKRLHDRLAVPYFYLEWRQALKSLNLPPR